MSYRRVTTGTGLAAALTLVLAAAPGTALAEKPFAGAALKWATLAGGTSIEELTEFVKPWEAETGATIEPVILPHPGFAEKVMLDAASGVHNYDLITLNYPKVGQFVEAGLVLALDEHIASDSARAIDVDDFIPRLLETYGSWNGMTYGFPLKADGRLMIYRTDIFEQHGKEPAKTWDEFLELAQYFNGTDWDGDGEAEFGAAYRFNADVIAIGRFAEMQGGMGGRLIDEGFAPQIDTPESARALEMIVALAAEGPPDTMAMGFSEYTNTFLLGDVPHLVVWGQVPVTAEDPEKSKVVGNVGYAEVPGGAALLGGFGISVLAATEHPDAAYDFAAWFTSKETERARIAGTRNIFDPGRTSTYNDPDTVASRPWFPILGNNLANGVALPRIPEADELIQVLGQNVRRAAAGEMGIPEALADAQARWEEILRKAGRLE